MNKYTNTEFLKTKTYKLTLDIDFLCVYNGIKWI